MIRERVLRALAANREPGFHFAGNFCEVAFHRDGEGSRVTLAPGIHNTGPDGHVDFSVLAMVADMALAASIRAGLDPRTRLATVSMMLQMTGLPPVGPIEGRGRFEGFFGGGDSRQGLSRVVMTSDGKPIGFGHGAFMALEPPPGVQLFPMPGPDRPRAKPLAEDELEPEERELLLRADTILADPQAEGDFLRHFLGFHPRRTKAGSTATMKNGAHVANRVGHVQGGLLAGFAAACANQALPSRWSLSAITACFTSPGQGAVLRATSRVRHQGLMTAVVHTEVIGANRRRVLEAVTTHARASG